MMENGKLDAMVGVLLEENGLFTLEELCHSCRLPPEQLLRMVEHGVIDPIDYQQTTTEWQFAGNCVVRVRTVIRLQQDLGINLEGAALAVELLDEIRVLRARLE